MELIFVSLMLLGLAYISISLIFGEMVDVFEGMDIDLPFVEGEGVSIGCAGIAAFFSAFGAAGFVASHAGAPLIGSIMSGVAFGILVLRIWIGVFSYVKNQEVSVHRNLESYIGKTARASINVPGGKTGEAMIEEDEVLKFAVKEVDNQPLHRGDALEIVAVDGHYLYVRKRSE